MTSITVAVGDFRSGKSTFAVGLGAWEVEHSGDVADTVDRTKKVVEISVPEKPVVVSTHHEDEALFDELSRVAESTGRQLKFARFS